MRGSFGSARLVVALVMAASLLSACPVVRGTGRAVSATGEGVGHAVDGIGGAIEGTANETEKDMR